MHRLAARLGVQTEYRDGLGTRVAVGDDTLVRVCAALGAPLARPDDASEALTWLESRDGTALPSVIVAWDGVLPAVPAPDGSDPALDLEDGTSIAVSPDTLQHPERPILPWGYHHLRTWHAGRQSLCTIIAAPTHAWRPEDTAPRWGVGTHLAALRSRRSRAVGDLHDLETTCRWIRGLGGRVVTVLPLLPTFNDAPVEPSPYAPVSRLFWSELLLDLGDAHQSTPSPERLDVARAAREVIAALADAPAPPAESVDEELRRYAMFRAAQARLGRNWRAWPAAAREGRLSPEHIDPDIERFHLVAQLRAREQLDAFAVRLGDIGLALGLDLSVGVHSDGYDPWSRPELFASAMSVGAPPDPGFPSGQDWGFPPVLPTASRAEGHAYLAAALRHQARIAGVLRIDHVMALQRLYWIPHGMALHQGTYVSYPAEELFAIATLESHRCRCELVGENLGTVPDAMQEALHRHRIPGMHLAQFAAHDDPPPAPTAEQVAFIGTHDTPTFAGWIAGADVPERLGHGLLDRSTAAGTLAERAVAVRRLASFLGASPREPEAFVEAVLEWLGRSPSPLVLPWIEDLWLETRGVNLPGTGSDAHPNWQRPMSRLLDDVIDDPGVTGRLRALHQARTARP